ncbi:MAG: thioesterase family protein, partial [Myxococcota bacterium]
MTLPAADAPFDSFLDLRFETPRSAKAVLPDGWQQGRGLYGGLVTALLVRALEDSTPERPLRSLTAELCGPVQPGEVTVELDPLRAGNAVTTTAVRLVQGGEVQAHGVGVMGKPRPVEHRAFSLPPPELKPWREVEVLPVEPPFGPDFARYFEYRS